MDIPKGRTLPPSFSVGNKKTSLNIARDTIDTGRGLPGTRYRNMNLVLLKPVKKKKVDCFRRNMLHVYNTAGQTLL